MTDNQATTLLGREEIIGRKYPIFLERIVFVMIVAVFIFGFEEVRDRTGDGIISVISTWCLLPFILLFSAEIIARVIKAINRD